MGIKGLHGLILKHAPHAIRMRGASFFEGRALAIDTNIFLYSFVAAIRKDSLELVDAEGNPTSHLKGILHRTLNLLEAGITPVYVLEGKSPVMKQSEVDKRREKRKKLQEKIDLAQEYGDEDGVARYSKQMVNVTQNVIQETSHLLHLLGIPVIQVSSLPLGSPVTHHQQAPSESEAQCAEFCKKGQTWGIVTRDMDALPLGCPLMLRNLHTKMEYTAHRTRVEEISLLDVLEGFGMEMEQFRDLCIMLGCDYCGTVRGIGPQKAFELIRSHKSIEMVLEHLNTQGEGVLLGKDGFSY
jgi:flap endonuclease-1